MINLFDIIGNECDNILYYNNDGFVMECNVADLDLYAKDFVSLDDGDTINLSRLYGSFKLMKLRVEPTIGLPHGDGYEGYRFVEIKSDALPFYLYDTYSACRNEIKGSEILSINPRTNAISGRDGEDVCLSISKDIKDSIGCGWKNKRVISSPKDIFVKRNRKKLVSYVWNGCGRHRAIETELDMSFIYTAKDKTVYDETDLFFRGSSARHTRFGSVFECEKHVYDNRIDREWIAGLSHREREKYRD